MPRKESLPWPRKVRSGHSIVTIYRSHYKGAWRYQLRYMQGGSVVREAFSNEMDAISQAENKADELNAGKNGALTLNPELAVIYRAALNACASVDKDVSLDTVCREWAEIKRRLGHVAPMTAIDDYVLRHSGKSIPLNTAVDGFISSRKGVSVIYLDRLKLRLKHLKEGFGGRLIADISEQEIREYVDSQKGSPRNRKNMRDAIISVWRWARESGYLARDLQTEAERVKAPIIKRAKRVEIFTPDEMKKLLASASVNALPILVICGFAGVRSLGEIQRLQWEDIKWDRKVIDVAGKTGEHRFVPIPPNLAAWLANFKTSTGTVAKINPTFAFQTTAESSGVAWRHNGLRHSFGSYRVAQTKNIHQTSLEMGNSPVMVRRHYLEAVHEDEAKEWFGIMPPD